MNKPFAKKYYEAFVRAFAALMLSALTLLLIYAFDRGLLPYSEDGDAFDTVYAIEGEEAVEGEEPQSAS